MTGGQLPVEEVDRRLFLLPYYVPLPVTAAASRTACSEKPLCRSVVVASIRCC